MCGLIVVSLISFYVWVVFCIVIGLEARLRASIAFTLRGNLAGFTRSAITPPKMNRFGWNKEHSEYTAGGWLWQILGAICAIAAVREAGDIFCQVNNARFRRFPVGNILRNLNTTTSIGEAMKTFGTKYWIF